MEGIDPARGAGESTRVWDLPLRLCHWGLVAAVLGAFATHYVGTTAFAWHVLSGCTVLALVAFRVAWGFAGTRHARFRNFVRGPRAALAELRAGGGGERPGHTVLGGWMTLALLAALLGQALTGLVANDEVVDSGPLAAYVARRVSDRLSAWHEVLSTVILALLALHVAAALYYALVRRDDRIRPLVTGRRPGVAAGEGIGRERRLLALALFAVAALLIAWVVLDAPPPPDLE